MIVRQRLARPATALVVCWLALGLAACSGSAESASAGSRDMPRAGHELFTRLPSSATGVRFENRLEPTAEFNVFTYRNYYNGGGVAIGDLTGDGLPELVLTSNLEGTRVYRNEETDWGFPWYFKFDSGNLQAEAQSLVSSAEAPKWVLVTHYGWRIPMLSMFPNVVELKQHRSSPCPPARCSR